MSTDVASLDKKLNDAVLQGKIMEAFEEHYSEDIVMQENSDAPFNGKATNREREQKFVDSLQEVHSVSMLGSAVNGDRSYSEWQYDVTFQGGQRMTLSQVAARQWKDGKVAHERFYYKG